MTFTRQLHRFLNVHSFYSLLLATLLTCTLFSVRVYLTGKWLYDLILLNLFLAWVPYGFSLLIAALHLHAPQRRWWLPMLGVLWLLFLPNAPYVVSDLIHLTDLLNWPERKPIPLWYDISLFAIYIWVGMFLGLTSLNTIQAIIKRLYGQAISWLFVLMVTGLCGVGIFIGRWLQWNSWDMLLRPHTVLSEFWNAIRYPTGFLPPYLMVVVYALLIFMCYIMFTSMRPIAWRDSQEEIFRG